MKQFRNLVALVLALVMVLSVASVAFASGEQTVNVDPAYSTATKEETGEFTNPTGSFSGTPETTITASNLVAGDTVEVYQLVEWDTTNSTWKLSANCGVTIDQLINGITEAEATTIAGNIANYTLLTKLTADNSGAVSYNCSSNPGLFYLKAIPADTNKDTVYNPAFVSADYYAGGNTVDFSTAIGSSTVLKKSSVPFDKKVNSTNITDYVDVKPGDVIPYKITTTIPSYGTSFTNPVFTITDTLSAGLTLDDTITVKYGNETTTTTVDNIVTITKGNPSNGFTVAFAQAYLTGLNGATPAVEITYSATVGTVTDNVTYLDNKAKLTFTNKPGQEIDKDDITRHYTFSIDGNLLGHSNDQTDELIKVACKADGTPIYESTTTYYDGGVNPLDGAIFTLTSVGVTPTVTKTQTSAAGGHIQFLGLDAGQYELVETQAPAGYTRDTRTYEILIDPVYDNTSVDYPILQSYSVKFRVKGATEWGTVSTFSVATNEKTGVETKVVSSEHAADGQYIGNTPGNELPSTGGIGTTIFYVAGIVLVLGAAAIIIARRKAEQN